MNVVRALKKIIYFPKAEIEENKYKRIASLYNISGYKRMYLVHIRKTGGTSLNHLILSIGGTEGKALYKELAENIPHRLIRNEKIFVGWSVRLINKGNYYYAFSHTPVHKLSLPDNTFTLICFRDPVKRVISHYNMLMNYSVNNIRHSCMDTEGQWLGNCFRDFIENMPKEHMSNQLYMLSKGMDINEAISRLKNISHVMFTEEFDKGVYELSRKTGLTLHPVHIRKSQYRADISENDILLLKEKLNDEYAFLEKVRDILPSHNKDLN